MSRKTTFFQCVRPIFIVNQVFFGIPLKYSAHQKNNSIAASPNNLPTNQNEIQPHFRTSKLILVLMLIAIPLALFQWLLLIIIGLLVMHTVLSTYLMSILPSMVTLPFVFFNSICRRGEYIKMVGYLTNFDEELRQYLAKIYMDTRGRNKRDISVEMHMREDFDDQFKDVLKYKLTRWRPFWIFLLHLLYLLSQESVSFLFDSSAIEGSKALSGLEDIITFANEDGAKFIFLPHLYHFLAYIKVIEVRLAVIHNLLMDTNKMEAGTRLKRLKIIKHLHLKLYKSSVQVYNYFNLEIFAMLSYTLMCLITRLQVIVLVLTLIFRGELLFEFDTIITLMVIFTPVIVSWMICAYCQDVIYEVKNMQNEVNSQLTRVNSNIQSSQIVEHIKEELGQFQMQIKSVRFEFKPCGMFAVGNRLLFSMLAAILNFTFIFYPFMFVQIQNYAQEEQTLNITV